MGPGVKKSPDRPSWVERIRRAAWLIRAGVIALLFAAGVAGLLLYPILPSRRSFDLKAGDIAPQDILATRQITYVSQIETNAARTAAAASISDVYDAPDPRVGRQQVRAAQQIMDFVRDVRADPIAPTELKVGYITAVQNVAIQSDTANQLLSVSDSQFDQLAQQIVSLVEGAMGGTVLEGRVQDVTRGLELKISSDLPESLIPLTLTLADPLVVPNSFLNATATDQARQQAQDAIQPVKRTFQPGEVIVRAGEPVDETDLEAMVALGLTTRQLTWQNVASAIFASLLATAILITSMAAQKPSWAGNLSHVRLVAGLFLIFLFGAQYLVPGQQAIAFLFPAAALAMALRALIGLEFSALITVILAAMVGYLAQGSLEIAAFTAASGLLAAATLRQGARLIGFFQSGLIGALGGVAVLLIFRLPTTGFTTDLAQTLTLTLLNGLFSTGITIVILIAVGGLTSMITSLQLIDLMRPDHPLQRRLQQEALGTYQHTLSVANLVEAAAEAIGADSLLARVGTLYHDIGKMANPGFFIENRVEGSDNPHDHLTPVESATIIKAHVSDGMAMARSYRLPQPIAAFIAEHHGTLSILFFLDRARTQAEAAHQTLDERPFFYDGPIPASRETAVLMLADGCESAVRANRPASNEDIDKIVDRIIQQRLDAHQLDGSGLTLNDVSAIRDSFVRTLRGMYHPRIRYPGDEPSPR